MEEERTRAERERARSVESRQTRKRLDALEKAAKPFHGGLLRPGPVTRSRRAESIPEAGSRSTATSLSPQYAQVRARNSRSECWLTVLVRGLPRDRRGSRPGGDPLPDGRPARRCGAKSRSRTVHAQPGGRASGQRGRSGRSRPRPRPGSPFSVGPIEAESTLAVLAESEADRYRDRHRAGSSSRPRYRIRGGSRSADPASGPDRARLGRPDGISSLTLSSDDFRVSRARGGCSSGRALGIAVSKARPSAVLDDDAAPARSWSRGSENGRGGDRTPGRGTPAAGAGIVIRLEDVDHGALRYGWKKNVLEVGALHPGAEALPRSRRPRAVSRAERDIHFRVLLAEVVAEALCAPQAGRRTSRRIRATSRG